MTRKIVLQQSADGSSHATTCPSAEGLKSQIDILQTANIESLRVQWLATFNNDPPAAFGPDLLRRNLAQKLQEQAYGGLSARTTRILDRLISVYRKSPGGPIQLPRRIKAGSVLVREWRGNTHRVTVLDGGFIYDRETYPSLSEIARLITGANWNGPRFFGLRKSIGEKAAPVKSAELHR